MVHLLNWFTYFWEFHDNFWKLLRIYEVSWEVHEEFHEHLLKQFHESFMKAWGHGASNYVVCLGVWKVSCN